MNIKEFSKKTDLTPRAIRLYEAKGLLRPLRSKDNKYKKFSNHDVDTAKKIVTFKNLGFSLNEIVKIITKTPSLNLEQIADHLENNLKKLLVDKSMIERRILETKELINSTKKKKVLTKKQRNEIQTTAFISLSNWSLSYLKSCLDKRNLSPVEQLQMIACAYADLVLKFNMGGSFSTIAESHQLIGKTLKKAKEPSLAHRHEKLAKAYENLAEDPNYYDLPI